MAKVIRYKFKHTDGVDDIIVKTSPYSEEMKEVAKREIYEGEPEVYDDGQPEPAEPSLENRVENLETETSDLSEALEMILSGVTE